MTKSSVSFFTVKGGNFAHSRNSKEHNPNSGTFQGLEFSFANFQGLWQPCILPFALIMTPVTDLCSTCRVNNNSILRAANLSKAEKSDCANAGAALVPCSEQARLSSRVLQKQSGTPVTTYFNTKLFCYHDILPTGLLILYIIPDYTQQIHYPK